MRVILACAGALLAAALPQAVARAEGGLGTGELFWITFADGSWFDPVNWSEPRVPTAFDTVIFKNEGEYTVTCGVPATVDRLLIRQGFVTFLLTGGSIGALSNTGQISTVIGEIDNDNAFVKFRDGRFQPTGVTLGLVASSQGTASFDTSLTRFLPGGPVVVGDAGDGTLAFEHGARAQIIDIAATTTLGREASGSGALYLYNTNTRWTSNGRLVIGERGVGSVQIGDNASLITAETSVAVHAGAAGALHILDATATINGDLLLGFGADAGQAHLSVGGASTLTAHTVRIGALSFITGNALIRADIVSAGAVRPGDLSIGAPTPSVLTIDGDYTMLDGASLRVDVGASTDERENSADRLAVSGHAHLDGALIVDLLFGAELTRGERFDILTAESRSGRFDDMLLPTLDAGLSLRVRYTDLGAQLRVVPAPAAAPLAPLALGLLARRRR